MRRFVLALFMLIGLAALPGRVQAQEDSNLDDEARVHFRLGSAYYQSGRFTEAAREFQRSYELSRRPGLLYNIFVSHRDAGNLGPAIEALRLYLQLVPDAENREQLTARLASMERIHRQQGGETAPAQQGPREQQTQAGSASSDAPGSTRAPGSTSGGGTWVPGWIVGGVGAAAAVAGIITGVLALGEQSTLGSMCDASGACDPGYEAPRDSAALLAGMTDGLVFGGIAVAAVGVVLALVISDGGESPSASLSCGPNGCVGTLRARF